MVVVSVNFFYWSLPSLTMLKISKNEGVDQDKKHDTLEVNGRKKYQFQLTLK